MTKEEKKREMRSIKLSIVHCYTYCIEHPVAVCKDCHFYKKQICCCRDWYRDEDGIWHWYSGVVKDLWKEYKLWRKRTGRYRGFFGG